MELVDCDVLPRTANVVNISVLVKNISECKKRFLCDNEDPRIFPDINQSVAESWIRSKNLGIDPYSKRLGDNLQSRDMNSIIEQNQLLLDSSLPLINTLKPHLKSLDYAVSLLDSNGTILHTEGEKSLVSYFKGFNATAGSVMREDTGGTLAHALCLTLRRPVQLLGPEHYCIVFQNYAASAAPILDKYGNAIAVLVLCQPCQNIPSIASFQKLCSHTLSLIIAVASAVEARIMQKMNNDDLEKANNHLKTTNDNLTTSHKTIEAALSLCDEGIIIINAKGTILYINQENSKIFKKNPDDILNRNISEFLSSHSELLTLIANGKRIVNFEESILAGNVKQPYLVSSQPVFNPGTEELAIVVLKLIQAEKLNALSVCRAENIIGYTLEDIIGESKTLKQAIAQGRRFAKSSETVLLNGESGTGKELFAQAIHNEYRPNGPFIAINCAALPKELIESELFGYEGGSFTGAERSGRAGKIELANGGTLFLDEIGDMPLELQAVLLRVLEDKQVMRVGGRSYKKVDFRVIAATNVNLYIKMKEKKFREDLFYRLSALTIKIPPLRDRENDVEILSHFFVEKYCHKNNLKTPQISPATQKKILEYNWPGNVRQLENAMICAIIDSTSGVIEPENLPYDIVLDTSFIQSDDIEKIERKMKEDFSMETLEKMAIEIVMKRADNYIPLAADLLGVSKSTLYRKLKEYHLDQ
ncbi:Anaerobic nitric oxide reductase transcription regulator NorR [Sporomusa silvacetica DSM 10669]|uniref:Anaerobic nitric oxide reductase transcription regulator NorR n=1 Tax=Sporomusa silvacetica DSM 10669 TaxID=1123289 RepID=A0ABZ3IGP3_9FIRM|nr:sigma 54-interacting transcriptional regulator [Sporomusa silvacetica]OZC13080.1 nitrogen assimilation regulatory protein [Sporomusa silvacetica DSM 10669]